MLVDLNVFLVLFCLFCSKSFKFKKMPDVEIRNSFLARCNHKEVTNMLIHIFRKNVNITNDPRNDEIAYGNVRLEPFTFFKNIFPILKQKNFCENFRKNIFRSSQQTYTSLINAMQATCPSLFFLYDP
jgi:hypothetical protein